MYKSTGFVYVGSMSSAAANSAIAQRLPQTSLNSSILHHKIGRENELMGSFRGVEVMLASAADSDSMTCVVYQGKRVLNKQRVAVGWLFSPLCTITCDAGSDTPGSLATAAGETVYVGNTYAVTAAGDATTPKGVGTAVDTAYNGSFTAFSPTDGGDGRVIISDFGAAEILAFDIYGGAATNRHVFVEATV